MKLYLCAPCSYGNILTELFSHACMKHQHETMRNFKFVEKKKRRKVLKLFYCSFLHTQIALALLKQIEFIRSISHPFNFMTRSSTYFMTLLFIRQRNLLSNFSTVETNNEMLDL